MDKIDTTGRWAMSVGDGRCQWSMGDVSGRLAMSMIQVDWRCQWSMGDVSGRWAMSVVDLITTGVLNALTLLILRLQVSRQYYSGTVARIVTID